MTQIELENALSKAKILRALTYPALQSSRETAFLVTGAAKKDALRRARAGDRALPAGRLRPVGGLCWFADRAAMPG